MIFSKDYFKYKYNSILNILFLGKSVILLPIRCPLKKIQNADNGYSMCNVCFCTRVEVRSR